MQSDKINLCQNINLYAHVESAVVVTFAVIGINNAIATTQTGTAAFG